MSRTRGVLSGALEGHLGLESEAAHPGLQSTLVHMSGARLSFRVILQEPVFVAIVTFSIVFQ